MYMKNMIQSDKKPHCGVYMYTNITSTNINKANEHTNMTDSSGLTHLECKIKQLDQIKPLKLQILTYTYTTYPL